MDEQRTSRAGLVAFAIGCAAVGLLELTFACTDGDQLPGGLCHDGHLTAVAYGALVLAAFVPALTGRWPVRRRAIVIVVLCVLVPFCLGYLRIGP